jgi:lipopolysaccharide biosynthesis glycosyltransferase
MDVIRATVSRVSRNPKSSIHFKLMDVKAFHRLPSLHGNHTTYARLMLHDLLPEVSKCIYLDCDIVVAGDVADLWAHDLSGFPIGGVSHTSKANSLEQQIWGKYEISGDSAYYNAGVLLMDLDACRRELLNDRILQYFNEVRLLPSAHDQTALNVIFNDRWSSLPNEWNFPAWCGDRLPDNAKFKLLHFVGAPKPWDLLGQILNPGASAFKQAQELVRVEYATVQSVVGLRNRMKRSWRIRRPYLGSIRKWIPRRIGRSRTLA